MVPVRSIAAHLRRWLSSLSCGKPPDPRHELGRKGERIAERYLRRRGYKVLWRNFRAPGGGEVDLVCRDRREDVLVFVEVKTRSRADGGRPAEAVDRSKQYLIAKGAMKWLRMLDKQDVRFRFDIVEVVLDEEEPVLIRDAFLLPEPYRW